MKKIYTLGILLTGISFATFAQGDVKKRVVTLIMILLHLFSSEMIAKKMKQIQDKPLKVI